MGADHEADPAVPDWASRDDEDGPAFDVWASRDREDGLVLPAQAARDHEDGSVLPAWTSPAPADDPVLPAWPARGPADGSVLPAWTSPAPAADPVLPAWPARGPADGSVLPVRTSRAPADQPALPTRASRDPGNGPALPVRPSRAPADGSALPVRTSRYRRTGRHSSPHQLSLPSDTPALVIAVPGSARPESEETATRIAELAGSSCHGAEVRIGYLRGGTDSLADVLDELGSDHGGPAAVVVPLLSFPNPEVDAAIADVVAAAPAPFLIAAHLGPHPLLAEALHARLADAGLARAARVGRINIVTAADGVIVGAAGDDDALEGAGVVAVLLASRLTMPVAAASLTDPASIKDAANRLREARVARVALAPCIIGPELTSGTLDAIAALTSTECAPPLGSHPAVAQLVAIRYGAALADPQVVSLLAEARDEPSPPSAMRATSLHSSPLHPSAPPSGAAT